MQDSTVTHLGEGIGTVVHSKGYARIMAGKRTLAYVNPRRDAVQLDFHAADVADAPARLRKPLTIRRDRALLRVNGKGKAIARGLLEHVAKKALTHSKENGSD